MIVLEDYVVEFPITKEVVVKQEVDQAVEVVVKKEELTTGMEAEGEAADEVREGGKRDGELER